MKAWLFKARFFRSAPTSICWCSSGTFPFSLDDISQKKALDCPEARKLSRLFPDLYDAPPFVLSYKLYVRILRLRVRPFLHAFTHLCIYLYSPAARLMLTNNIVSVMSCCFMTCVYTLDCTNLDCTDQHFGLRIDWSVQWRIKVLLMGGAKKCGFFVT